jgi:hypothetical protein
VTAESGDSRVVGEGFGIQNQSVPCRNAAALAEAPFIDLRNVRQEQNPAAVLATYLQAAIIRFASGAEKLYQRPFIPSRRRNHV